MNQMLDRQNLRRVQLRGGVILFAALIALATATVILFGVMQACISQLREVRIQRYQSQADLLATAGIERAEIQLRQSATYPGETWHIAAAELDGFGSADVRIQVEPQADQPDDLRIVVQADYPSDTEQRARRTREVFVHRKQRS